MMSLQSALIGFLLSRVLASSITAQENVVVQTTAVATGTMALAAGFVGIIPALGLLNVAQDGIPPIHLSWTAALAWSFAVAYYGILMSPPIRKQVVRVCPDHSSFSIPTQDRLSKKGSLSRRVPLLLNLFPSYTNSLHRQNTMQTQRAIPHSTRMRNPLGTMT